MINLEMKWRQLTAGLFDKALLFLCEQLTQLTAPIMTSLNEHLCCLKMRGGQRQQKCVKLVPFHRQQRLMSACWGL